MIFIIVTRNDDKNCAQVVSFFELLSSQEDFQNCANLRENHANSSGFNHITEILSQYLRI
jgi:hypothetical protein